MNSFLEVAPKTVSPLALAAQRCVKGTPHWATLETVWMQHKPAMVQHQATWNELDAKSGSLPATMESIAEWLSIATKTANLHMMLLPEYTKKVKRQVILCGKVLLKSTESWDDSSLHIAVSTVDQCLNFTKQCMIIDPSETVFGLHYARLQKLLSNLGCAAVMKDLKDRAGAMVENMCGAKELQELGQTLSIGGGVDLRSHAPEITQIISKAIVQVAAGCFDDCDMQHVRHTFEHLQTVASAAGLQKHALTLKTQAGVSVMMRTCKDVRALGVSYADIAVLDTAEKVFGNLHREVAVAENIVETSKASEVGVFDKDLREDEILKCRTVMADFSAVSLENKDRALAAMAEKVCDKGFLDPATFQRTWDAGITTWDAFTEKAKATISNPDKLNGLKQLITDTRGVFESIKSITFPFFIN